MAEAVTAPTNPQTLRGKPSRTTIQVSPITKDKLDLIKQEAHVETYEEAILFRILVINGRH